MVTGATQLLSHPVRPSAIEETGMQPQPAKRCAYCQEPFYFNGDRMRALPAGNQFVCSEFCAQALREEAHLANRSSVGHAS
jgi:hypothetical protein